MVCRTQLSRRLSRTRAPTGRRLALAAVFVFLLLHQFLFSPTRLPPVRIAARRGPPRGCEARGEVLVSVDVRRVRTRVSKVHPISVKVILVIVVIIVVVNPVIVRLLELLTPIQPVNFALFLLDRVIKLYVHSTNNRYVSRRPTLPQRLFTLRSSDRRRRYFTAARCSRVTLDSLHFHKCLVQRAVNHAVLTLKCLNFLPN